MIVIITGASHTGKTLLAQRLLEKYRIPYLSADHLKMGLIRSGMTRLTPEDDALLTGYLWPLLREMIKTAIENRQSLTVEGCYVPFDWRKDLEPEYLRHVRFVCLALTAEYIDARYEDIVRHACDIEARLTPSPSRDALAADNRAYIEGFRRAGERVALIDSDWEGAVGAIAEEIAEEKQTQGS
ncbi:MAG: adenylate kinase [Abditibacteriota bacterium]|nr:adenylate kinase [Abditibacteriota bacterium]